jgi:hypothetical protein
MAGRCFLGDPPLSPSPSGASVRPTVGAGALRDAEGAELRGCTCCPAEGGPGAAPETDEEVNSETGDAPGSEVGTGTSPVNTCDPSWVMIGTSSGNTGLDSGATAPWPRAWLWRSRFPRGAWRVLLEAEGAADLLATGRSAGARAWAFGQQTHACLRLRLARTALHLRPATLF